MTMLTRYLLALLVAIIALTACGFIVEEISFRWLHRELSGNGHWFDYPQFHRTAFFFLLSGLLYFVSVAVVCLPIWMLTAKFWPVFGRVQPLVRGMLLFASVAALFFVLLVWDNFTRFQVSPFSIQTFSFALSYSLEIGVGAVIAGGLFGLALSTSNQMGTPA